MTEEQLYNVYALIESIKVKVGTIHINLERDEKVYFEDIETWEKYDAKFDDINDSIRQLENEVY